LTSIKPFIFDTQAYRNIQESIILFSVIFLYCKLQSPSLAQVLACKAVRCMTCAFIALLSLVILLYLIMSIKYKFHDSTAIYFVSFAVVGWIDVFTRTVYRDLLLESLTYCRKEKGLNLHAWVIMSNHVHLIVSSREGYLLANIMRD